MRRACCSTSRASTSSLGGKVAAVDTDRKIVHVERGGTTTGIPYDQLLFATDPLTAARLVGDQAMIREIEQKRFTGTSGKLTEKQPRGFGIDPTGRLVVVSGEKSDTISSYAIDAESGALKPIGRYPTGKGANWVEILAFD